LVSLASGKTANLSNLLEKNIDIVQDHTGDPSTFPLSTDLIVGPGFKSAFVPAWPTNPDSPLDEKAWENRHLREIDFNTEGKGLKIGQYSAFDFYGDGSFYLLDTPGHAIGHMCGLARTSINPPEFIFMGGDIAHHGGEFRPTQYLPLPKVVSLGAPFSKNAPVCPGEIFEAIHRNKSSTEPFYVPTPGVHADVAETTRSIEKLYEFDADERIFVNIAHDISIYDMLEYYPKTANGWSGKGWKEEGRWRFLKDFEEAAKAA
jgi:glyoxylase-like metal-dependent hydrolase (beta-lactamase superfamily II)